MINSITIGLVTHSESTVSWLGKTGLSSGIERITKVIVHCSRLRKSFESPAVLVHGIKHGEVKKVLILMTVERHTESNRLRTRININFLHDVVEKVFDGCVAIAHACAGVHNEQDVTLTRAAGITGIRVTLTVLEVHSRTRATAYAVSTSVMHATSASSCTGRPLLPLRPVGGCTARALITASSH